MRDGALEVIENMPEGMVTDYFNSIANTVNELINTYLAENVAGYIPGVGTTSGRAHEARQVKIKRINDLLADVDITAQMFLEGFKEGFPEYDLESVPDKEFTSKMFQQALSIELKKEKRRR